MGVCPGLRFGKNHRELKMLVRHGKSLKNRPELVNCGKELHG